MRGVALWVWGIGEADVGVLLGVVVEQERRRRKEGGRARLRCVSRILVIEVGCRRKSMLLSTVVIKVQKNNPHNVITWRAKRKQA